MEKMELNWKVWLKRGDQNLKPFIPSGKKSKFGAGIRYNLLSMSLENYIMAILDYFHTMPDNHTYTDLLDALETVMPVETKLKDRILKYENIQSICSIDKYIHTDPTEEELIDLTGAIFEIKEIAYATCV